MSDWEKNREIESLREQLAEAHKETDSVVYARDEAYRMLAECERERDMFGNQRDVSNREIERLRDEVHASWKRENELEELEKRQFKVIMYLQDILEKIASITPCSLTKNIALIAKDEADKMLVPK